MCKNTTDDFCVSLVVGISNAVVAKIDGFKNPPMRTKVFNFSDYSNTPIGNHLIMHQLILQGFVSTICRDETL